MIARRAGTLAKQKRLRIAVTGLCVSPNTNGSSKRGRARRQRVLLALRSRAGSELYTGSTSNSSRSTDGAASGIRDSRAAGSYPSLVTGRVEVRVSPARLGQVLLQPS